MSGAKESGEVKRGDGSKMRSQRKYLLGAIGFQPTRKNTRKKTGRRIKIESTEKGRLARKDEKGP